MPDLNELLDQAARVPSRAPDPDEIWEGGRRRRTVRRTAVGLGGAALTIVLVAGVGALLPEDRVLIEPVGPTPATSTAPTPDASPSASAATTEAPSAIPTAAPAARTTFSSVEAADGPALGRAYVAHHPGQEPALIRYRPDGRAEGLVPDDGRVVDDAVIDADGNIAVALADERSGTPEVVLLPPGGYEARALTEGGDDPAVRRELVGAGVLAGPVVLVAEGRAESLDEDEGTDIVAYASDGTRTVVVPDAAGAWEGGVSSAAVRDGWVAWQQDSLVTHVLLAAAVGAEPDAWVELATFEPETGEDPRPVELLLRSTDGPPVVQVLAELQRGYPDAPQVELRTYTLPGGEERAYPLDGFGWEEGLPRSLSALGDELVVGRLGEQLAPRPVWVGGPGQHRELGVEGIVRVAR